MEFCSRDVEVFEFVGAYFDAGFVLSLIQRGTNREARLCGCVRDQIHYDLVAGERTPAPVFGNKAEEPMLNLVPLAGAWGKVTYVQGNPEFVRQTLQRLLPKSIAAAVASASIGGNQKFRRAGKRAEPISLHQRWILAQANSAVSWSMPTLTQPSLQAKSYTP